MAFMVFVPSSGLAGAVLGVVGHGPDEFEGGGEVGSHEGVPDEGPPASYLGYGVAEGHYGRLGCD